ncbi:hypothetical protein [Pantoea stewartii]|uniref:hypothetical protein n=1 Tax=Pantoea stewartii TaxID=66269 RepID=UPI0025A17E83|nr:hypothetical protein [Pantoea stewartii]
MFRSVQEKVNIVIGEALLLLIDDDADISNGTITEQLKQMLEEETDNVRRQIINNAIRQTGGLFGSPVFSLFNDPLLGSAPPVFSPLYG